MKTLSIAFILFLTGSVVWAQESRTIKSAEETSKFTLVRDIMFNGNSEKEEITIEVPPGTIRFDLEIIGELMEGKYLVEVLDPDQNKKGNFVLSTQKAGSNERVSGHFEKYLKDPQAGSWIIRVSPTKAHGEIRINSTFFE